MDSGRQVAIIAPQQLVSAFSVLIHSTRHLNLLASATSLEELLNILDEKKPDVLLVYLVQESSIDNGNLVYKFITRIKNTWPYAECVTIVKYASQLEKAKEYGADLALVDGVNAERLLAAIEGQLT